MAHLSLCAFEAAFAAQGANGGSQPTADVRYTLGRLAMAAPGTAARLPRVRAALDPVTLAAVIAQVGARPGTPPAPQPAEPADSEVLSSGAAARLLGSSSGLSAPLLHAARCPAPRAG
jgi:hypothetical protein